MKLLSCLVCVLAVPAFMFGASANGPMITNSTINYSNNQITIVGQNFTNPSVSFNKAAISVLSVNAAQTQIVAQLPTGIFPGSYLLTVTNPAIPNQPGSFNVAYGAIGPQGPRSGTSGTNGIDRSDWTNRAYRSART